MKKFKLMLILMFIMLGGLAIMAGCNTEKLLITDENRDDYYEVITYYNGGIIGNESAGATNSYGIYYSEKNARLPYSNDTSSTIKVPSRPGFTFSGWYQIDKDYFLERTHFLYDSNGKEIKDAKGDHVSEQVYYIYGHDYNNPDVSQRGSTLSMSELTEGSEIFATGKPWQFDFDRVKEDIVLVAMWKTTRQFVCLFEEIAFLDPNASDFLQKANAGIRNVKLYDFESDGAVQITPQLVKAKSGSQIEGYYFDRQTQTNPVQFLSEMRFYPSETDEINAITGAPPILVIYVRELDEKYTIVKSSDDIKVTGGYKLENKWYWFKSNINLNGAAFSTAESFTSGINGNNYKITNFVVNIDQDVDASKPKYDYGGLFNTISNATITNLTFEGMVINFRRADPGISAAAAQSYLKQHTIYSFARVINSSALVNVHLTNVRQGSTVVSTNGLFDRPYAAFIAPTFVKYDDNGYPYALAADGSGYVQWDEARQTYVQFDAILQDYVVKEPDRDQFGSPLLAEAEMTESGSSFPLHSYVISDMPDNAVPLHLAQTSGALIDYDSGDKSSVTLQNVTVEMAFADENTPDESATPVCLMDFALADLQNLPFYTTTPYADGVVWSFAGWYDVISGKYINKMVEDGELGDTPRTFIALWRRA